MRPSRAVCRSERGMVATAHCLGSDAALDVLKQGGSAVDAAICAAATLGVVLPHMIGIGGDAFWLIYDAQSGRVQALNGSGPCGRNVKASDYATEASIPHRGPRAAITVPGAVDSWRLAHERFGRLPLARLHGACRRLCPWRHAGQQRSCRLDPRRPHRAERRSRRGGGISGPAASHVYAARG